MKLGAKWLLAAISIMLPLWAQAQPFGYASAVDKLYRVNLANGSGQVVGAYGSIGGNEILDVEGLAMAADGSLYGVADGRDVLIRIDTATGRALSAKSLGLEGQGTGTTNDLDYGLAFTCDGKLWASSTTSSKLWEVDRETGATRFVGNLGARITGLAARADGLYGVGSRGDEALYRISTTTGRATQIGRLAAGLWFSDAGLDFDGDGNLWATLDFNPPPLGQDLQTDHSDLVRIDPVTGAMISRRTVVSVPQYTDLEGLAIAPPVCGTDGNIPPAAALPVPASSRPGLLAFALSILVIAGFRRRRLASR